MSQVLSKIDRRGRILCKATAAIVAASVLLAGASGHAEISRRAQLQAAQRAYQASARQYNEVARAAAQQWGSFSRAMAGATFGALSGGAVGAAGGAARAAYGNR